MCRFSSAFERGVDAIGHEMECGASFHPHRRTRIMGEYEHGGVIGRVITPPPLPCVIAPIAALRWPKHVATHKKCTEILCAARSEIVVDPGLTSILASDLVKGARHNEPIV